MTGSPGILHEILICHLRASGRAGQDDTKGRESRRQVLVCQARSEISVRLALLDLNTKVAVSPGRPTSQWARQGTALASG